MIQNYLIVAFRNFLRQKGHTLINIFGLMLGICMSLLIVLYIHHELSYEHSYPDHELIYRVGANDWAKSSPPLAEELEAYFPQIDKIGRFAMAFGMSDIIELKDRDVPTDQAYFADPSVIDIFDFKVLIGNPDDLLVRPNTIVITESLAGVLFPEHDAIGKVVNINIDQGPPAEFEITGIIRDLPDQTHLDFPYLISMSTFYSILPDEWTSARGWMVMYTYVVFRGEKGIVEVESALQDFVSEFFKDIRSEEEIKQRGDHFELYPIDDIHLRSHREQEMGPNSDIAYIYMFGALAVLIVILASANFINIFISQSLSRIHEIGIRKVVGAFRSQLVWQFLLEAFMLTLLSSIIALLLCWWLLPFFNQVAQVHISIQDLFSMYNLGVLLALAVLLSICSGAYPAFLLSGLEATHAFRGDRLPGSGINLVRKGLIVLQFIIAAFMIISTMVVYKQLHHFRHMNLGFDREGIVSVRLYGDLWVEAIQKKEVLREKLMQNNDIIQVASTSNLMGNVSSVEFLLPDGVDIGDERPVMRFLRTDEHFIEAMGIELVDGTEFNPTLVSDSTTLFIINEKAADVLHLTESPVGMMATNTAFGTRGQIVGVMKNFNFASLHSEIEPLIIEYRPDWTGTLLVRINPDRIGETVTYIEGIVKEVVPGSLFLYSFLDDHLDALYHSEKNMSRIFQVFSILAIVISCLGLFGLASFSARMKMKEIGIRKAFGASTAKILIMISGTYLRIITVAVLVAIPVANYLMTDWLKGFAYRIRIEWWIFGVAGLLISFVGMAAIIYQSFWAASSNPVDSLSSE